MNDLLKALSRMSKDIEEIKEQIVRISKSRAELFKESWIDGQEVMFVLNISKRTLQSFRDNKTIPFSRINGKFYYKVSDLVELLENNYSINTKPRSHG
jgi:5-bromo-4-chloroindolyl phosphate hydrolysis protein